MDGTGATKSVRDAPQQTNQQRYGDILKVLFDQNIPIRKEQKRSTSAPPFFWPPRTTMNPDTFHQVRMRSTKDPLFNYKATNQLRLPQAISSAFGSENTLAKRSSPVLTSGPVNIPPELQLFGDLGKILRSSSKSNSITNDGIFFEPANFNDPPKFTFDDSVTILEPQKIPSPGDDQSSKDTYGKQVRNKPNPSLGDLLKQRMKLLSNQGAKLSLPSLDVGRLSGQRIGGLLNSVSGLRNNKGHRISNVPNIQDLGRFYSRPKRTANPTLKPPKAWLKYYNKEVEKTTPMMDMYYYQMMMTSTSSTTSTTKSTATTTISSNGLACRVTILSLDT